MTYLSLMEMCEELSISPATGRNWIKLEKIKVDHIENNMAFFDASYVQSLKSELSSGKSDLLKSRRNKKYISGNGLYDSYVSKDCQNLSAIERILSYVDELGVGLDLSTNQDSVASMDLSVHQDSPSGLDSSTGLECLLVDCALHLFASKYGLSFQSEETLILSYLTSRNTMEGIPHLCLIESLISNRKRALSFCQNNPELFKNSYVYEPGQDVLGLLYISCRNMGNRKAAGAYYTPNSVVKKLIGQVDFSSNFNEGKLLDPCCGTGNFLLQLHDEIPFESIYGNDLDELSVKITRINMALKYDQVDSSRIIKHITCKNFLTAYRQKNFDYIIGNPPWGYVFTKEEKKELKGLYSLASQKLLESYDIFIEAALKHVSKKGQVYFVVPEAILNVKAHRNIRKLLMEQATIKYLAYLGESFHKVQCPSIIFGLKKTARAFSTEGMVVDTGVAEFTIHSQRQVSEDYFDFNMTDEEYQKISQICNSPRMIYLKDNADFALGIVTGNNKEFISGDKVSSDEDGSIECSQDKCCNHERSDKEVILRGSDICQYYIKDVDSYISFEPDKFQQCAPVEMYRAKEKLLYRFINSRLTFAYDDKQRLTLNSCNILIPHLEGLNIKYLLAVLNSSTAQFIFEKKFHSVKVLRSHIESLPIPMADEATQQHVATLVDQIIKTPPEKAESYKKLIYEIDEIITQQYFY